MSPLRTTTSVNPKKTQLVTNLHELMLDRGVTEAELSRQTDIPQATLHKILSGRTSDPRISTLNVLAQYFGCSIESLFTFAHSCNAHQTQATSVPLISWEECADYPEKHQKASANTWQKWVVIDAIHCHGAYALSSKSCMTPRFPKGSIFVIEPNIVPSDGDLVIVLYPKNKAATLRELSVDGPQKRLLPIKDGFDSEPFEPAVKILGTVIQSRFSY